MSTTQFAVLLFYKLDQHNYHSIQSVIQNPPKKLFCAFFNNSFYESLILYYLK